MDGSRKKGILEGIEITSIYNAWKNEYAPSGGSKGEGKFEGQEYHDDGDGYEQNNEENQNGFESDWKEYVYPCQGSLQRRRIFTQRLTRRLFLLK